jgi:hypothetical protein
MAAAGAAAKEQGMQPNAVTHGREQHPKAPILRHTSMMGASRATSGNLLGTSAPKH